MSCFKKIRVRRKKFQDSHLPNLFKQKDELFALLKEAEDGNDEDESDRINRSLEIILDEISSKCAEENKKAINKVRSLLVDTSDGINPSKIWDVKKKLIPKITPENPSAMKDKRGNIVTDKNHIKKLLRDSYKERLEPNKIEDSLEELEQLKEFLYSQRLSKARLKLTRDWNLEDLNQVLKNLPNGKSRDLHGHTYELFKFGGTALKLSLVRMANNIKLTQRFPKILLQAKITSIWKGKSDKSDPESYRGVFSLVKARSIIDRLIYNDNYYTIDAAMSCSNIGARKKRNIRDHLFVFNSVVNEISVRKHHADVQVYDVRRCFDKMWGHETLNDIFEAGLDNDQFAMVASSSEKCEVYVKAPWGSLCDRFVVTDVEMQGSVLAPLRCSVQVDSLGKQFMSDQNLHSQLFRYLGCVSIPPLSMIDDVITITECGVNSINLNAAVQSKIDSKRLTLNEEKCVKMHFGRKSIHCPSLKIHSSMMKSSSKQCYLGDIYTTDCKTDEHIQMRYKKGVGIVNN